MMTLADRLAEAEETIIQLRQAILPEKMPVYDGLRLTRSEAIILKALIDYSDWVSIERLAARLSLASEMGGDHDDAAARVYICRLRPKLKAIGVKVDTSHGIGYSISNAGKARLASLRRIPTAVVRRLEAAVVVAGELSTFAEPWGNAMARQRAAS